MYEDVSINADIPVVSLPLILPHRIIGEKRSNWSTSWIFNFSRFFCLYLHPILLHWVNHKAPPWDPNISLKGTVPRDFPFHVFFMNQFPPSPWVSYLGRFVFFFSKIRGDICISRCTTVSLIPGVDLELQISPRIIKKKFQMTVILFSGVGRGWFMKKT
jgi:hypothetical protein